MRPVYALGLLLALLPASRGADDAVAIIKRGIAAQGGPAAIRARAAAEHYRMKCNLYVLQPGADTPTKLEAIGDQCTEENGRQGGSARNRFRVYTLTAEPVSFSSRPRFS